MRLANNGANSVIASEGVQTTSAFNIARTPHMFNILSSGLYSDKIAAVLREVGCNAMDAHIMNDSRELPFQVKLPTSLDRSFYVKDWGPGLDDRELRELYTTYGWSSKQQNDETTGAFGLGSKSPFAYTMQNEDDADGFTVESAKDGRRAVYTCYIDEAGAPAISRMYEGPADADWPHGVKVTFPVQSRDVSEFHEKARDIYRWFRVKPEVLGLSAPLTDVDFRFQGSFFAMQPKSTEYTDRGPCVIMGNVRYPLNVARLRDLSKCEEALLKANIHLSVPLGSVMMTPSREDLEYTDRTRKGISEWLHKAVLEVAQKVCDAVMTEADTKWAWYKKIQEYYDTLPFGIQWGIEEFLAVAGVSADDIANVASAVKEKTATMPKWAGDGLAGVQVPLQRDPETGNYVRDAQGDPLKVEGFDARSCRVWLYQLGNSRGNMTVSRREVLHGRVRNGSEYAPVNLSFLAPTTVFYADGKQADARVRAQVREGVVKNAILVVSCRGTEQSFSKEYATRLTGPEGLHGVPLEGVSTLEIPSEVEEQKLRRKLAKEQGPRAFFADTDIQFLGLNGTLADTTLGEVEDTEMFYLCARDVDSNRRAKFRNSDEGTDYSFDGYYRSEVMRSFGLMVTLLDLPVTGCVIVNTVGHARRLKLEEQGFKPFLPYMAEQLTKADHWTKISESVNRNPSVSLEEMYHADDYGWLGILGHHAYLVTNFWKAFIAKFPESPLVPTVLAFVKQVRPEKDEDTAKSQEMSNAVATLSRNVHGLTLRTASVERLSHYDVRRAFVQSHPTWEALNEGILVNWMNTAPDRALGMLEQVMALDLRMQVETPALDAEDAIAA